MAVLANKRVLVTGGSGFIGQKLITRLLAEGASVWSLTRSALPQTSRIQAIRTRLEDIKPDQFGNDVFDCVFHLGAFTPKNKANANAIDRIISDNIIGTAKLLQALPHVSQAFVFASTLDVYTPPVAGAILTEESEKTPQTLYGSSKLFCEDLVSHWAQSNQSNLAILRLGHVYGPGEESYQKIIPETIRQLQANRPPVLYNLGIQERDFIYVDDVVEAIVRAANRNLAGAGPINIVSGKSVSLKSLVQTICQLMDYDGPIEHTRTSARDVSYRFDNRKMKEWLGEWEMVSLANGLASEIANTAKNSAQGLPHQDSAV